jgi:hypothetical protein
MPRFAPLFAGLAVVSCLTACNPAQIAKIAKIDPGANATATAAYRHVWNGEDAAFEAMLEPAQRGPQVYALLDQIRTVIPPGKPDTAETVSWNNVVGTGGRTITLVQTYGYVGRTVAATVVMVPDKAGPDKPGKDAWLIRSFHVNVQVGDGATPVQPSPPDEPASPIPGGGPVKPI